MLPREWQWLAREGGPRMLVEALALHGAEEYAGGADNPVILGWARECGVADVYRHDSTAWCGLFMGVVARRAGWADQSPKAILWARSWAGFGVAADQPSLGDVMVFARQGGGHVALYVGESADSWFILGGNQSDRVSITARAKASGMIAVRRPRWRVAAPPQRRPILITAAGPVPQNVRED